MICINEGIHIIIIIYSDEKNTGNGMNYTLNLGMLNLAHLIGNRDQQL